MKLRHALVIERHFAAHQDVQHDTEAPDVNFRAGVLACLEQLGCREIQTSAKSLEQGPGREQIAEAEINDLDIANLADQNVFDLQVPVYHAVPMAIVEGAGDLSSKFPGLLLFETAVCNDVIEHLPTIDILEQHIPVVIRFLDIDHFADVRMMKQGHQSSLSGSSDFFRSVGTLVFCIALLIQCLARDDLDGSLFTCLYVLGKLYFAHGSLANGLA